MRLQRARGKADFAGLQASMVRIFSGADGRQLLHRGVGVPMASSPARSTRMGKAATTSWSARATSMRTSARVSSPRAGTTRAPPPEDGRIARGRASSHLCALGVRARLERRAVLSSVRHGPPRGGEPRAFRRKRLRGRAPEHRPERRRKLAPRRQKRGRSRHPRRSRFAPEGTGTRGERPVTEPDEGANSRFSGESCRTLMTPGRS